MDITATRAHIRRRIAEGDLAGARIRKTWVGPGLRRPCDACGRPVAADELEYEHELADGSVVRLDGVCDALWRIETGQ